MVAVWLSGPGASFGWGHPEVTRGSCHHYLEQKTQELSLIWSIPKPRDGSEGSMELNCRTSPGMLSLIKEGSTLQVSLLCS